MASYYIVGNVNGPISKYVQADSADAVQERFDAGEFNDISDDCANDAEDMLGVELDDPTSTTDTQFDALLRAKGLRMVRGLDEAAQANSGGGWYLWVEA